jgi:hypothetical protein
MRSVRLALVPWLAVLCAGLLAAPRAAAQEQEEIPAVVAPGPVSPPLAAGAVVAAVGGEDDVTRSVLVGPGGQVYEPGAPGAWQRQTAGGIGPEVVGAVRVGQTLFAHGAETPVFRRQDAVWHAHPLPNRGRCAMGTGGVPALAIARYVYTWPESSAGGAGNAARGRSGWTRLTTLAGVATAVWAQTPARVIAATAQGMLWRVQGSAATAIPHPLAAGDRVVVLTGMPRSLYGLSQSGAVLRIGERRATLVDRAPALAGWMPQAMAVDAGGVLWALGWVPARGAEPVRAVLARTDGKTLRPVENIADLLPLDRFLVLRIDRRGGMLWSTQSGVVRYRPAGPTGTQGSGESAGLGTTGAAWQAARVISELSLPVPSFPGRGPAVAR